MRGPLIVSSFAVLFAACGGVVQESPIDADAAARASSAASGSAASSGGPGGPGVTGDSASSSPVSDASAPASDGDATTSADSSGTPEAAGMEGATAADAGPDASLLSGCSMPGNVFRVVVRSSLPSDPPPPPPRTDTNSVWWASAQPLAVWANPPGSGPDASLYPATSDAGLSWGIQFTSSAPLTAGTYVLPGGVADSTDPYVHLFFDGIDLNSIGSNGGTLTILDVGTSVDDAGAPTLKRLVLTFDLRLLGSPGDLAGTGCLKYSAD